MDLQEFRNETLGTNVKKQFKVTNSNGTKEAWRWLKKNKWLDLGQPVTERQFGEIIKAINLTLQDQLLEGKDVLLPHRMGRLEIRKLEALLKYEDNRLKNHLPINWAETLKLWWEDEESRRVKRLVRFENTEVFVVYYNKKYAKFKNKTFYKFTPTRHLKLRLKDKIKNVGLDALLLKKRDELYQHKAYNGQAHKASIDGRHTL